jgi:hypothetical protein
MAAGICGVTCWERGIPAPIARLASAKISARKTLCPLRNLGVWARGIPQGNYYKVLLLPKLSSPERPTAPAASSAGAFVSFPIRKRSLRPHRCQEAALSSSGSRLPHLSSLRVICQPQPSNQLPNRRERTTTRSRPDRRQPMWRERSGAEQPRSRWTPVRGPLSAPEREKTVPTGFLPSVQKPAGNAATRFSPSSGQHFGNLDRRKPPAAFSRLFNIIPVRSLSGTHHGRDGQSIALSARR